MNDEGMLKLQWAKTKVTRCETKLSLFLKSSGCNRHYKLLSILFECKLAKKCHQTIATVPAFDSMLYFDYILDPLLSLITSIFLPSCARRKLIFFALNRISSLPDSNLCSRCKVLTFESQKWDHLNEGYWSISNNWRCEMIKPLNKRQLSPECLPSKKYNLESSNVSLTVWLRDHPIREAVRQPYQLIMLHEGALNFSVCEWNPKVWPFKWRLLSST